MKTPTALLFSAALLAVRTASADPLNIRLLAAPSQLLALPVFAIDAGDRQCLTDIKLGPRSADRSLQQDLRGQSRPLVSAESSCDLRAIEYVRDDACNECVFAISQLLDAATSPATSAMPMRISWSTP